MPKVLTLSPQNDRCPFRPIEAEALPEGVVRPEFPPEVVPGPPDQPISSLTQVWLSGRSRERRITLQSFESSPHVLAVVPSADLVPVSRLPADQNPALVYLTSLAPGSRRTMQQSLNSVAALLTEGRARASTLDWSRLRYQNTAAVRAALIGRLAPATLNKTLAAVRRVLKEAWRLGQTAAVDYHRAADVQTVKAQTLPRGRALTSSELNELGHDHLNEIIALTAALEGEENCPAVPSVRQAVANASNRH